MKRRFFYGIIVLCLCSCSASVSATDYGVMTRSLPPSNASNVLFPARIGNFTLNNIYGLHDYTMGGPSGLGVLVDVHAYKDKNSAALEFAKQTQPARGPLQGKVLIDTATVFKSTVHAPSSNRDLVTLEWQNQNYVFFMMSDTAEIMDQFMAVYPY